MTSHLVTPHGGSLNVLMAAPERAADLKERAKGMPSWTLSPRQLGDVEALLSGAFSPLGGYLGHQEYDNVCRKMRLGNGTLWPMPVTLDVTESLATTLEL